MRIQSMNGVNIEQFVFEYDLTWMSFFQNAEGQTYARYGGREDHDAESHLTKESLLSTMRQVLRLHQSNDIQTVTRYEPAVEQVRTPEEIPTMMPMMAKRKETCIHCHDVKVAELRHLRNQGRLQKEMIYTYPSPSNLGLHLDPDIQFRVRKVDPESAAEAAGILPGDLVMTADGQRVLTFGDLTRVLELAPETGALTIVTERGQKIQQLSLNLPAGWREVGDPSWRPSTEAVGPSGGFWGVTVSNQKREELGLSDEDLAIKVNFIWGEWIREAGIQQDDVVIAMDGVTNDMTIRQLHAYLHMNRDYGDTVPVVVRRGEQEMELTIRLPDEPNE